MGSCVSDQNININQLKISGTINGTINRTITETINRTINRTITNQNDDICIYQLNTLSEQKDILSIRIVDLKTLIDIKIKNLLKNLDEILPNDFLEIIKKYDTSLLCKKLIDVEDLIMDLITQSIDGINIFGIQFIDKAYLEKSICKPLFDCAKNYPLLEINITKLENWSEVAEFDQQIINYETQMIFIETNIKNMTLISVLKNLKIGLPFILPKELEDTFINDQIENIY